MVAPSEQAKLNTIIAEARSLLENQRRALREADFGLLLSTADGFHRLAAQLGSLSSTTPAEAASSEVKSLRDHIANHLQLLDLTISTTTLPTPTYNKRGIGDGANRSLLIDHYA